MPSSSLLSIRTPQLCYTLANMTGKRYRCTRRRCGRMFTGYLCRGGARLCAVYALSITLSTEAQGTVHSTGDRDTPVICMHNLLVSEEGKTVPGMHEALPADHLRKEFGNSLYERIINHYRRFLEPNHERHRITRCHQALPDARRPGLHGDPGYHP